MKWKFLMMPAALAGVACIFLSGCETKVKADPSAEAPPPAAVEKDLDPSNFKVDHPDQFPLVTAEEHRAAPELNVTGVVNPDVSRNVPVPSLATGRVVEIDAQLGQTVRQGQLLFKVRSTDVSGAYSDYRKAVANEQLARVTLERQKLLFEHGAAPKSSVEVAQNAEDNAKVDVETAIEHLRLLGSDPDHPTAVIEVTAPVSGVITDQQITNSSGVQALSAPNPFTISDLSHVWIICDVYENDLKQVHVGEYADIHLAAYPDRVLKAKIGYIAPILDPAIRTAKVRLEVENPGLLRIGMFVTATFHGLKEEVRAAVPATAILHLHDREWVYTPGEGGHFRRVEVVSGKMLANNMQEIVSGLAPGARVVANALTLQSTVEQ
ncbi:MAG TPA: efflux RND transporter periplasmic adaptor subunit [Bryobacteraceae bacterium]|jgi:cobalt-zinc-cadmium efflux system membrane fusion protein|nr:efflux RND transporter periplasmic adaptor subunit [Bryobacteraceae bacterium]